MRAATTFDLVGDLIGVDAVVTGPTGTFQVKLILDTAAVLTTMVPSVAESIGYSAALRVGWSVTRTAAAEERGYIVRAEVSTLGFTMPNHRVVVADLGYGMRSSQPRVMLRRVLACRVSEIAKSDGPVSGQPGLRARCRQLPSGITGPLGPLLSADRSS